MALDIEPLRTLPKSGDSTLDSIHQAAVNLAAQASALHADLLGAPLAAGQDYASATTAVAAARDQITLLLGTLAAQATRSAVHEVATWTRQSHHRARRFITGHALMNAAMPRLREAVATGAMEHEAALTFTHEASLAPSLDHQRELDRVLSEDAPQLTAAGTRAWRDHTRRRMAELDPQTVYDRAQRAQQNRRVTLRDADDEAGPRRHDRCAYAGRRSANALSRARRCRGPARPPRPSPGPSCGPSPHSPGTGSRTRHPPPTWREPPDP